MAVVIIEGGSSQGKSILAKDLSVALGLPIIKENKPTVPGFQHYLGRSREIKNAIFDRFHIGESVYPILYDDSRQPLERWQQHMIERCLLTTGVLLIHTFSEPEFRKARYLERGDPDVSLERLTEESDLFLKPIDQSLLQTVTYNMALEERSQFIEKVRSIISDIDNAPNRQLFRSFESIGPVSYPTSILVADRYGDGSYVGPGTSRVLSSHYGCSAYLARALDLMDGERFYITNATKHENMLENYKSLGVEIDTLNTSSIIALGDEASAFLRSMGVKHIKVYHPQYMFRFHNRDVEDYARMIKEAL